MKVLGYEFDTAWGRGEFGWGDDMLLADEECGWGVRDMRRAPQLTLGWKTFTAYHPV